jgi:hypothetical protein
MRLALGIALAAACVSAALAQEPRIIAAVPEEPRITNARQETLSAAAGLRRQVEAVAARGDEAAWIGYAVPTRPRARYICCLDSWKDLENWKDLRRATPIRCGGGCRLERAQGIYLDSDEGDCVAEDPWNRVFVLLRLSRSSVTKVRAFTPDCPLDAGGLPLYWLTDVAPEESVRFLESVAGGDSIASEGEPRRDRPAGGRRRRDDPDADERGDDKPVGDALMALALHAHESADRVLERLVAPGRPPKVREQAAFWMGQERGRRGFDTLRRLARQDASPDFREQVAFAISESKDPDAVGELVRMARTDRHPGVRGQAIFWLAQHAGREAVSAITEAMENDPDVEVKKKAVFALSELPPEDGVPLLIRIARTHANFAVRKEAIFWLGESGDPRALDFLEEILLGAGTAP